MLFQENYMKYIAGLVGIMAIVALGAYTYSSVKTAKYLYQGPTTISVTGKGEATGKPDIASISFNIEAKEVDAKTAQEKVDAQMKEIMEYLKGVGVEEKDIKTENYAVNQWYDYSVAPCTSFYCPSSEPKLKGYQVNQPVMVKVRDTAKVGEILSNLGSKNLQNVNGPNFTIDDMDVLKAQAREAAIKDAQEKAEILAKNLDVRLGRMTGYWEEDGGMYPTPMYNYDMRGDMMMKSEESIQPITVPAGETKAESSVSISYEIHQRGH